MTEDGSLLSGLAVILHGIGMNRLRMAYLDYGLKQSGFKTLNLAYPSLRLTIEESARHVAEQIRQKAHSYTGPVHFVCHSMGSLVALDLLHNNLIENLGRAVFIAPPYRGSEVADTLAANFLYRYAFGPAGQQLTTHYRRNIEYTIPDGLEVGVIAGTRAYEYPLFLSTMKKTGAHDGLVSVESTRIPFAKDHITIRMSHSFLLETSVSETAHFLQHGRFKKTLQSENN